MQQPCILNPHCKANPTTRTCHNRNPHINDHNFQKKKKRFSPCISNASRRRSTLPLSLFLGPPMGRRAEVGERDGVCTRRGSALLASRSLSPDPPPLHRPSPPAYCHRRQIRTRGSRLCRILGEGGGGVARRSRSPAAAGAEEGEEVGAGGEGEGGGAGAGGVACGGTSSTRSRGASSCVEDKGEY